MNWGLDLEPLIQRMMGDLSSGNSDGNITSPLWRSMADFFFHQEVCQPPVENSYRLMSGPV